ncbi:MAG: SelB C-terminal domain-containing protein, partial [Candidatus Dormibacteria bacterium]
DRGIPRLHVDRSFSRPGVGTVVTGVLVDGRLTPGQQVEVFPSGARGRILELQRRGRAVEAVEPGGRLAASLRGVPAELAPRGSVLGRPGDASGTTLVDCLLEAPEVGASGLRQGAQVEVLCGTATSRGRVWLAGEDQLVTGSRGFAQLVLESPLWAVPGDRIVLRGQGPVSVLAGGVVLDAHPRRHRRWADAPLDQWAARERALQHQPDLGTLAVLEAGWAPGGLSAAEVGRRVGCSPEVASAALQEAEEGGRLARLGQVHIDSGRVAELRAQAVARVASYQRLHPLEPGMPRRQLLAELGLQRPGAGDALLSELAAEGRLEQRGGTVAEGGSRPPGRTAQVERVAQLLRSAGRLPPGPGELRAAGLTRQVEGYLVQSGEVARLPGGGLISALALEEMESEIEAELRRSPSGLTVAQLRDRVGTSRRILLPVLERLEAGGEFTRSGDLHLWRPERSRELRCG